MNNHRNLARFPALATLALAACLAGCASESALARRWQSSMLSELPDAQPPAKVVVLKVPDMGRLTPHANALSALERAPGVRSARRGAGENELYALVDGFVKPQTLVDSLGRDGHSAWVVRVVTRADLDAEDEK